DRLGFDDQRASLMRRNLTADRRHLAQKLLAEEIEPFPLPGAGLLRDNRTPLLQMAGDAVELLSDVAALSQDGDLLRQAVGIELFKRSLGRRRFNALTQRERDPLGLPLDPCAHLRDDRLELAGEKLEDLGERGSLSFSHEDQRRQGALDRGFDTLGKRVVARIGRSIPRSKTYQFQYIRCRKFNLLFSGKTLYLTDSKQSLAQQLVFSLRASADLVPDHQQIDPTATQASFHLSPQSGLHFCPKGLPDFEFEIARVDGAQFDAKVTERFGAEASHASQRHPRFLALRARAVKRRDRLGRDTGERPQWALRS